MKQTIREISNNQNLEVNLPKYAANLMSLYNRFAYIRFTMNYYGYYEVISENESDKTKQIRGLLNQLNEVIGQAMLPGIVGEELVHATSKVNDIRSEIVHTMQILTAYVDVFNIYEHVLNRVEYRFVHKHLPDNYSDELFCKEIMQYLLSEKDNSLINLKITEMIRQLPIRMTKGKFNELVRNGLSIYRGNDRNSLNDYLYMLRTTATLDIPWDADKQYPDLHSIYMNLKETDYRNLNETQYEELHNKLLYASSFLQDVVDLYVMLTELVNDVYAIMLSRPYAITEADESEVCDQVIKAVNQSYDQENLDPLGEEVMDILIGLEGRQEKISEQYISMEYLLDDIKQQHSSLLQSMALDSCYNSLYRISDLLSGSLFIELNNKETDVAEADEIYIKQEDTRLRKDLYEMFQENDRMVGRAVMSSILAELPIFFNDISELQDYIYSSLDSCKDVAEKKACVEILKDMMDA